MLLIVILSLTPAIFDFNPIIREAVETACGRQNFTVAFWNADLIKDMLLHEVIDLFAQRIVFVVLEEMFVRYSKLAPVRRYMKTDNNHSLRPVIDSLRREIHSKHNAELEAYNYHGYSRVSLSPAAQANLTQATKASFEFVETTEMRRRRIETAARAYSRFVERYRKEGGPSLEKQMALVSDLMIEKSSFKNFTEQFDPALMGTGIRPLEILPAIESLYIQFRSLNDKMAQSNVIAFLISMSKIPSDTPSVITGLFQGISIPKSIYYLISIESRTALDTTFPEMIAHLRENQLL